LGATLDQMIYHAEAVVRGAERALVVVDVPFPYCQLGPDEAVRACARILKETEATAVKIEGGASRAETVRAVVAAGIPVVGHCGLVPQSVKALGGYKVQRDWDQLLEDATAIQEAGAFAVVLECVEREHAAELSKRLTIPTIGIGSGAGCDGQVQVVTDILGLSGYIPKHAKQYADLKQIMSAAFQQYVNDVRTKQFPAAK
jgi:3-methyl-2-oxobutanoate hydroxymethyltransferase